jgi:hypothetical protein
LPSSFAENNARPVKQWALKTWLEAHSLDGQAVKASNFNLIGIWSRFLKVNPAVQAANCNLYIGERSLADGIKSTIVKDGNMLYGVPVTFVPGAVGAMLIPPGPATPAKT